MPQHLAHSPAPHLRLALYPPLTACEQGLYARAQQGVAHVLALLPCKVLLCLMQKAQLVFEPGHLQITLAG